MSVESAGFTYHHSSCFYSMYGYINLRSVVSDIVYLLLLFFDKEARRTRVFPM